MKDKPVRYSAYSKNSVILNFNTDSFEFKVTNMLQETALNYKILLAHIGELINISGYRNDFIAKKLGLKPTTFSMKKQRATWSFDEIEKLLAIIENEETEDYYLGLIMNAVDTEDTMSLTEFKNKVGWK